MSSCLPHYTSVRMRHLLLLWSCSPGLHCSPEHCSTAIPTVRSAVAGRAGRGKCPPVCPTTHLYECGTFCCSGHAVRVFTAAPSTAVLQYLQFALQWQVEQAGVSVLLSAPLHICTNAAPSVALVMQSVSPLQPRALQYCNTYSSLCCGRSSRPE